MWPGVAEHLGPLCQQIGCLSSLATMAALAFDPEHAGLAGGPGKREPVSDLRRAEAHASCHSRAAAFSFVALTLRRCQHYSAGVGPSSCRGLAMSLLRANAGVSNAIFARFCVPAEASLTAAERHPNQTAMPLAMTSRAASTTSHSFA